MTDNAIDAILSSLELLHERLQVTARNQELVARAQIVATKNTALLAAMVGDLDAGVALNAEQRQLLALLREMGDGVLGEQGTAH